jgi:pyruvate dehydrogenase (quinone)
VGAAGDGRRPHVPSSQELPSLPYADYARLLGLDGAVVDSPDAVGSAWDAALAADRPFLIHAVVDPAVPLLPPRLEPAMKQKLLSGLDQEGTELARRARALVLAELDDQERGSGGP